MTRVLPALIQLALMVFCLIDCIQTDSILVRNLSKGWWILLIIFVPIVGPIAWLVAGRPQRQQSSVPWPSTRTSGFPEYERPRRPAPDDDPEFLSSISKTDDEHERTLRQEEENLRKRESELRDKGDEAGEKSD